MESIEIKNLSFTYSNREKPALEAINLKILKGEFVTVCGKSGCGKTTLLRLIKPSLAPFGNLEGEIFFEGKNVSELSSRDSASKIGFVMQNCDNQIVTDKVWHELAFGLESLGYKTDEIRAKVSEMASFFGIETWFHKKVSELSGGQKQLLSLASVMVMQPSVLILDEPTSQLDPIASQEFLNAVKKINLELGVTVILSEHRLEEAFPHSDKVVVMEDGKICAEGTAQKVGEVLKLNKNDMYKALPTPMRIYGALETNASCPITVRDGRLWLEELSNKTKPDHSAISKPLPFDKNREPAIEAKDIWFRYEKNSPDVIKGMNMKIYKGEFFAIVGGNGTGKTTAVSLLSALYKPYRGSIEIFGQKIEKVSNLHTNVMAVLPQNPQSIFSKKTVKLDLEDVVASSKLSKDEKSSKIANITSLCQIEDLLDSHPYDLSGGEQQRVALAKVLLKDPQILLLDEPTKGMDAHFKEEFAYIIEDLIRLGVTVVMVTHDVEFCAMYAHRCAMFFDGSIVSEGIAKEFFAGKSFYTTAANRMARNILPEAIVADDIILAFGGKISKTERPVRKTSQKNDKTSIEPPNTPKPKKLTPARTICGCIFSLLFALTTLAVLGCDFALSLKPSVVNTSSMKIICFVLASCALFCFFPQKEFGTKGTLHKNSDKKLSKRTIIATFLILLAIPFTIYSGIHFFGDRKYYFISLLIIIETTVPFLMVFENRHPKARELVIISVLCAIAVAGRTAFIMIPQFKPVVALVIIAGVCFGGETGFLVGAVTGFVSNFFFGQGPWTPWQMFAFGIIGFLAGIVFKKGLLRKTRASLCIFTFVTTIIIYGGIMNPASVFMMQTKITKEMLFAAFASGLPFDLVHAASGAFFMWFISAPMIDKLERIKVKYGLIAG